eukprot:12437227-Alexandrium_andersonii.AAC.1
MPGGSWEPVASQAARTTAPMGAAYAARVQKACARVKRPGRAVGPRLERIARTAGGRTAACRPGRRVAA